MSELRLIGQNLVAQLVCRWRGYTVVCFSFSWSALPTSDPTASARNTVFFRTVELAYNQGAFPLIIRTRSFNPFTPKLKRENV